MMRLTHLTVLGPNREPATVEFHAGLNVIHGASDTGKSFLLSAIDFMLGSGSELKDIPERNGYDRMLLGVEFDDDSRYTFERATDGGGFKVYEGLLSRPSGKGTHLAAKHSPKSEKNISRFILSRLGIDSKVIRESKARIRALSFRDLTPLVVVSETSIIKEPSPVLTGQYIKKTEETSVFKLLLTGVDDSAHVVFGDESARAEDAKGRLRAVEEVIDELRRQLPTDATWEVDLDRVEAALTREQTRLQATESVLADLHQRRASSWSARDLVRRQREEIEELVQRFGLLDAHYGSDLARLVAIRESGSLVLQHHEQACPLCGAGPEHQGKSQSGCDGDVESVVTAAAGEIARVERLRADLRDTLSALRADLETAAQRSAAVDEDLGSIQRQIEAFVDSEVGAQRSLFSELVERRAALRQQVAVAARLDELETERERLSAAAIPPSEPPPVGLPAAVLDEFSETIRRFLKAWHFPNPERVHFDQSALDVVISGKARKSYGKGLRAITHAAFTLALIGYAREVDGLHPGFVVLDSPLLAYREPDPDSEGVRESDLKDKFYEHVAAFAPPSQVIIIENEAPPSSISKTIRGVHFSGNLTTGRYGLFPSHSSSAADTSRPLD